MWNSPLEREWGLPMLLENDFTLNATDLWFSSSFPTSTPNQNAMSGSVAMKEHKDTCGESPEVPAPKGLTRTHKAISWPPTLQPGGCDSHTFIRVCKLSETGKIFNW